MSKALVTAARRSAASYVLHGKTIAEPYDYLEDPASDETRAFVAQQNADFRAYLSRYSELHDKIAARLTAVQNYERTGPPSLRGGQYYYYHNTGLQNQNVLMRTPTLVDDDSNNDHHRGGDGKHDGRAVQWSMFLDPNELSADGTSALRATGWSKDETLFAYSVSDKGSDWVRIRVRDVRTATDLADEVQWAKFTGVSWWHNDGFFYTRYPALSDDADKGAETDTARDAFVCYHAVGTPQSADVAVLAVPQHPLWSLSAQVSDCQRYLVVTLHDGCEPYNLVWVAALPSLAKPTTTTTTTADNNSSSNSSDGGAATATTLTYAAALAARPLRFCKLVNEFVGAYAYLGNDAGRFYFVTTRAAPRRRIVAMQLPAAYTAHDDHNNNNDNNDNNNNDDDDDGTAVEEHELVAQQASLLNEAALVQSTLLLVYLEDVKDVVYYRRLDTPPDVPSTRLELPFIGSVVALFAERACAFVSLKVSSFLLPGRSYTLRIDDPAGTLRAHKDDLVAGLDARMYTTEQRFYHADDGTRIPMFIVYRNDCAPTPASPLLVYGYGGFNISLTPSFSALRLAYLQHLGGVLAIPNIRGGGEYGEAWHDAGRRAHKPNCFTDFVAAIRHLHQSNVGSPATTAIMGGSNGGLLVGAVTNLAPQDVACSVCIVGVLDLYKFHRFTIGHAWKSDYGDPDNADDFAVLERYSPLHNIRGDVPYPAVLVITSDHDDRVVPLHSLKYIATLQHVHGGGDGGACHHDGASGATHGRRCGPFFARVEVSAGHGAGKPTSKIIDETADMYTFIAAQTNARWRD